jgi:hypothetical protein
MAEDVGDRQRNFHEMGLDDRVLKVSFVLRKCVIPWVRLSNKIWKNSKWLRQILLLSVAFQFHE